MEHKPRIDLEAVADLSPAESQAPMSREERLARWIEVLEREPKRLLKPLHEIEYRSAKERRTIRGDNSPLTVAYEDPVLRADGLASDKLGDALDFFQLSEQEAHTALCSCHVGSSIEARHAAARVKVLLNQSAPSDQIGLVVRVVSFLFGR
jgi:hypothetical protein